MQSLARMKRLPRGVRAQVMALMISGILMLLIRILSLRL
jgi:hypothetical protein